MSWLMVAGGAAAGGTLRYGLTLLLGRLLGPGLPWGTFAANLLGCAAMGALVGLFARHGQSESLRLLLGVGLLGGFTTFSSYALDAAALWGRGDPALALAYVVGTPALALAGFTLGRSLA